MTAELDFIRDLTTGGDARLTPARGDLAASNLEGIVGAERYAEGQPHAVTSYTAPLFARPADGEPLLTEMIFGEAFTIYDQKNGWAWGQSKRDHNVGYAPLASLAPAGETGEEDGCTVTMTQIEAYREPDIKSPREARYPMHARLVIRDRRRLGDYRFLQLENGAWVRADLVSEWDPERAPWPAGGDYLQLAHKFLGAPYRWGGRTALGIDCSGLLQNIGVATLRDTDLQERELELRGAAVADESYQAGDLVFFPGHVGIMSDGENLLHANATRMCVSIDPLAGVIERLAKEHDQPLRAVYRLPDGTCL